MNISPSEMVGNSRGRPPGPYAALHRAGHLPQMRVAIVQLAPGVADSDHGLPIENVTREALGPEPCPACEAIIFGRLEPVAASRIFHVSGRRKSQVSITRFTRSSAFGGDFLPLSDSRQSGSLCNPEGSPRPDERLTREDRHGQAASLRAGPCKSAHTRHPVRTRGPCTNPGQAPAARRTPPEPAACRQCRGTAPG